MTSANGLRERSVSVHPLKPRSFAESPPDRSTLPERGSGSPAFEYSTPDGEYSRTPLFGEPSAAQPVVARRADIIENEWVGNEWVGREVADHPKTLVDDVDEFYVDDGYVADPYTDDYRDGIPDGDHGDDYLVDDGEPLVGRYTDRRAKMPVGPVDPSVYVRRRVFAAVSAFVVVLLLAWVVSAARGSGSSADTSVVIAAPQATTASTAPANLDPSNPDPSSGTDLVGAADGTGDADAAGDSIAGAACTVEDVSIRKGDDGASVECAQLALAAAGYDYVTVNGTFDEATDTAVRAFQDSLGLKIDGLLGKKTAIELGIWPGDDSFIVRTPPPAPGATDLWGMKLSSVASAGDDAPPLPDNAGQGTGKRVVYERASQRVWAVDGNENIVRSYLVSGSRFLNEVPGEHKVYSKSSEAYGWDLKASMQYMIRYTKTDLGNIGFHSIPKWRKNGEVLQTEDELGQKLSGGCTRQANLDAAFMWAFADVGTRVIVL